MPKGKLILLPNLLSYHNNWQAELPIIIQDVIADLDGLICESEKAARRFLALFRAKLKSSVNDFPLCVMNKHLTKKDLHFLFEPILKGEKWGVVVDSGLPCLADPGAKLVTFAQENQVEVKTIPGPSALIIALQLSGFFSQQFHFLGYLPLEQKQRMQAIRKIGLEAANSVQLFIETPYRNDRTLKDLVTYLPPHLQLCIACNLATSNETILRHNLGFFQKNLPILKKEQCIFLVSS